MLARRSFREKWCNGCPQSRVRAHQRHAFLSDQRALRILEPCRLSEVERLVVVLLEQTVEPLYRKPRRNGVVVAISRP